jgi:hypothetical protein
MTNDPFSVEEKRILAGNIVSATVSGHAGNWSASVAVDIPDEPDDSQSKPADNRGAVGLDMGITALAKTWSEAPGAPCACQRKVKPFPVKQESNGKKA